MTDNSDEIIALRLRMAAAIVRVFNKKGDYQHYDLLNEGFSRDEIALHFPAASNMAAPELKEKVRSSER